MSIVSFQLVSAKQELHFNLERNDWLLSTKLDRSRAVRALAVESTWHIKSLAEAHLTILVFIFILQLLNP